MSLELPDAASGAFSNAHHFMVQHSKFIDVKGNYIVNGNDEGPGSGIASLRKMAAIGAAHDGAERYPPPRCAAETRVEVLRQINHWIDNPRLNCPVLWLYGPAGAGKSAIAQTIAESAEESGRLAASFFFARTSETRNTANYLFPTIAYQLALHFPEYRLKVDDVMRKDPAMADKSIEVQFKKLLVDIWDVCPIPDGQPRVVSIDGIDECKGEKTQELFLTLIGQALLKKRIPLRFLFSSRPEPHLRAIFGKAFFGSNSTRIILDDSFNPTDDIVRYLRSGFLDIWEKHPESMIYVEQPWPTEAVVRDVALRASGQFIYASTVLKFINEDFTHPVSQLEIIQGPNSSIHNAFSDLDALYLQILSTHPRPLELMRILAYILIVKYPSPLILDNLLNKRLGTVASVLRGLYSLLEIPGTDSPWYTIEPYHASFLDFIEDQSRSGAFYVDKTRYYAEVAESCISLLTRWFYPSSSLIPCDLARLTTAVQSAPRLMYGLNALIKEEYRIECSMDAMKVTYFILVLLQGKSETPLLAWELQTREFAPLSIEALLDSEPDPTSLTCLSQLLQLDLDNPKLAPAHWRDNFRCLKTLAKRRILPPSLFVNNVTCYSEATSHGRFSTDVYKGKLRHLPVCVKTLRTVEFTSEAEHYETYKNFINEVLVWRQLSHPNIIPYLGANTKLFKRQFCLISPWMSNGNIMQYLATHPDHDILKSICEVIEGIRYLHSLDPPISHKDIKGNNILVNDTLCCCLADFGSASILELQPRDSDDKPKGSVRWMAPEIFEGEKPGLPCDIYSLGCTIYELYTGELPFQAYASQNVIVAVTQGKRPPLPPPSTTWTTQEHHVWHVVDLCWAHQPNDRPPIESVREQIIHIHSS